jgi:two-component system, NarL family, nitrate/nitrite response regulator NarL
MFRDEGGNNTSFNAQADGCSNIQQQTVVTFLVCENALLRTGLKYILLGSCFPVSDVNFHETLALADHSDETPVLYLIDASEASELTLETVRQIKGKSPTARVAVIADHFELGFVRSGLSVGVDGFCLTAGGRDVLIKSLELIMLGEKMLPGVLLRSMLQQASVPTEAARERIAAVQTAPDPRAHKLSPRETVILQSLMGGDPNKVIARKLDITEATIKVHVKAILRKIGAANRTQAAMWATGHLPPRMGASADS